MVVQCRDVTEICENSRLHSDNKMLGLMSSNVSHEMLTPMRCIISITDLMKSTPLDQYAIKSNLSIVSNTAQIVLNQIKSNLDNSLIENRQFQLKLEKMHLIKDVVQPTADIFVAHI